MPTDVKICPQCKATSPLLAPSCGKCGHVFRTQFAPNRTVAMPAVDPSVMSSQLVGRDWLRQWAAPLAALAFLVIAAAVFTRWMMTPKYIGTWHSVLESGAELRLYENGRGEYVTTKDFLHFPYYSRGDRLYIDLGGPMARDTVIIEFKNGTGLLNPNGTLLFIRDQNAAAESSRLQQGSPSALPAD